MREVIRVIMCFLASYGFGVLFNIHGKKLFWIGLGGAVSWMVYLGILSVSGSVFLAMTASSAAVVTASEVLARRTRSPVIMLMVPMLIPMVPGGDLYYTMSWLVGDDSAMFAESLRSLLIQAGAIAVGIIVMTSVMTNFYAIYYRRRRAK